MKAMTFDNSFAEKNDTFANLIANLSRMVLTTSERLFYIKLLTRGFRSTPTSKKTRPTIDLMFFSTNKHDCTEDFIQQNQGLNTN